MSPELKMYGKQIGARRRRWVCEPENTLEKYMKVRSEYVLDSNFIDLCVKYIEIMSEAKRRGGSEIKGHG